mgnify:CR=1 FL=1
MLFVFCLIFTLITCIGIIIFTTNYIIKNFIYLLIGLPFVSTAIFVIRSSISEELKWVLIVILAFMLYAVKLWYEFSTGYYDDEDKY